MATVHAQVFQEKPHSRATLCGGAGNTRPAVCSAGTATLTCLRPRTLAPSGGEKGNTLCFKSVFISVGAKKERKKKKGRILRKAWQRHYYFAVII